ncbi:MAG: hypothetical protein QNJ23_00100 [Woeseiaceae bacterium]|nr:hypothetical protein [Woeseiaceae bacterium]
MTDTRNDEQLQEQAKALFDNSVEELDAATLSRLNQGRHRALEELQRPGLVTWSRWAPAGGVVAVAVVAAVLINGPGGEVTMNGAVATSDFEMLLEADSLEMLEDLEFYSLLDAVDEEADGNVG